MDGSRWSPRHAGVAAAVTGVSAFLVTALSTGLPLLGVAVAVPLAGFTWVVWRRGGLGHRLRNRILDR